MRPSPDVLSVAFAALLSAILPAVAVAAAAWLLLEATPRMNGATRHVIWWLVLAFAVLLPLGFATHDIGAIRAPRRVQHATVFEPDRPAAVIVNRPTVVAIPVVTRLSDTSGTLRLHAGRWSVWLLLLWAGIFAAQLARLAWSYGRVRGIKQRSRPASPELQASFRGWIAARTVRRPVRLVVSDEVETPMAAGFLHPAAILPSRLLSEFGPAELDQILLHELSHLVRRDDWTNLLARVALAAFWFNPAAVWAVRRIEREREIACDEWVVAATGAPRPYAASLARLFELCIARRREALAAGMAGNTSQLGERIERLLRRKGAPSGGISILRVAGCTVALLALSAMATRMPHWVVLAQNTPPAGSVVVPHPAMPLQRMVALRSPGRPAPVASVRTQGPHSFLAAVVAAGYGDLSVDEIIQLSNNGVSAGYLMGISRAGWGKLKPRDIIDLHNSGVGTEFLRAVGEAGIPGITIRGVIDLNASGVTAAYIARLQSAGMGAFPKERIIDLHNSGVRPELLRSLKDAGFTHLDAREIIDAQNNGLRQQDLREAMRYGSSLTLKQVVRLKQAGVL